MTSSPQMLTKICVWPSEYFPCKYQTPFIFFIIFFAREYSTTGWWIIVFLVRADASHTPYEVQVFWRLRPDFYGLGCRGSQLWILREMVRKRRFSSLSCTLNSYKRERDSYRPCCWLNRTRQPSLRGRERLPSLYWDWTCLLQVVDSTPVEWPDSLGNSCACFSGYFEYFSYNKTHRYWTRFWNKHD